MLARKSQPFVIESNDAAGTVDDHNISYRSAEHRVTADFALAQCFFGSFPVVHIDGCNRANLLLFGAREFRCADVQKVTTFAVIASQLAFDTEVFVLVPGFAKSFY